MKDFEKLLCFANLLSIPVTYQKGSTRDQGLFIWDGKDSKIVLHKKRRSTENILTLLHELGHALDWISRGRPKRAPKVLTKRQAEMSRKDRYSLWLLEKHAIQNAILIDRMLTLEVSRVRLETERIFDLWVSSYFYRKGRYPTMRERVGRWRLTHAGMKRLHG